MAASCRLDVPREARSASTKFKAAVHPSQWPSPQHDTSVVARSTLWELAGRQRRSLAVWSQPLLEHPYRVIRRMRYGTGSSWERHNDRGSPSSSISSSRSIGCPGAAADCNPYDPTSYARAEPNRASACASRACSAMCALASHLAFVIRNDLDRGLQRSPVAEPGRPSRPCVPRKPRNGREVAGLLPCHLTKAAHGRPPQRESES
jgi:hypothetical protein